MSREREPGEPGKTNINAILERAKAEWEAAFDSISEGIAIVDPNGTVRRVNRALAALLGRDVRNMVGIACCDLFSHHREEADSCPVRNYPVGKQGTFEVFFPDYRYYEDSVHPILRAGKMQGVVITVRDITREQMANQERRHVYLQMEEASRKRKLAEEAEADLRTELDHVEKVATLGHLAGIVFAEVNRTVRMLRDGLGVVASNCRDQRKDCLAGQAQVIDELAATASRCAAMLDKLAHLRVQDPDAMGPVRIDRLVKEVAGDLAGDFQKAGIKTTLAITELPPVIGIRDQIRAVISSLLLNALEATREGQGEVRIGLRREGNFARIEVADDGTGIEPAHLPQIFNPFFSTAPAGRRVGLGLTICQATVQGHHGHIEVDSTPGQGTTVKVLLPVEDK